MAGDMLTPLSFCLLFNVVYDWHVGYRGAGTTRATSRV